MTRDGIIEAAIAKSKTPEETVVVTRLLCALAKKPMGSITRIRDQFDEVQKAKDADKEDTSLPRENKKKGKGVLSTLSVDKARLYAENFVEFWATRRRKNASVSKQQVSHRLEESADRKGELGEESAEMSHDLVESTSDVENEAFLTNSADFTTRCYKNITVHRRISDGFFNATAMCKSFKTHFFKYLKADRTQAYIDALANMICETETPFGVSRIECGTSTLDSIRETLVQVQHGGPYQGSWIHERIAVDLARWLSPDFAVWMDGWLLELLLFTKEIPPATTHVLEKPKVLPLPPLPIRLPATEKCLDDGPCNLYVIKIPQLNALRPGRTKDMEARLLHHQRTYGNDTYLAVFAPNQGHIETALHRHLRSLRQASESELVKADGISLEELCFIITELQERAKMASEDAVKIKRDSTEPHSRKRTREEAAMELDVTKIDAEISTLKERELLFNRTLQEKDIELSEKELCLKLAKEGDERAISVILDRMRRC